MWREMAQFRFLAECTYCAKQFRCYTQRQAENILQYHSQTHSKEIFKQYKILSAEVYKREITDKGIVFADVPTTEKEITDRKIIQQFWDNQHKFGLVTSTELFNEKTKGKITEIKNGI